MIISLKKQLSYIQNRADKSLNLEGNGPARYELFLVRAMISLLSGSNCELHLLIRMYLGLKARRCVSHAD